MYIICLFVCFLLSSLLLSYIISIIRALIKRIKFVRKLTRTGVEFFPTHRLWKFGNINKNECDFYIHINEDILAVKLIGRLWSGTEYLLTSRSIWQKQTNFIMNAAEMDVVQCGWEDIKVPDYDFKKNTFVIPDKYINLPIIDTLVFQPFPFKLGPEQYKHELIDGRLILSGDDLLNIIKYGTLPPQINM